MCFFHKIKDATPQADHKQKNTEAGICALTNLTLNVEENRLPGSSAGTGFGRNNKTRQKKPHLW